MSSFRLTTEVDAENPVLHDLQLVDGQVQWIGFDDDDQDEAREMIRQRVDTSLRHIKGEFFMDLLKGFPYFEDIFVKNPSTRKIRSMVRRYVEQVPGVASIEIGDIDVDSENRTMEISDVIIRTDSGFVVTFRQLDVPWLLLKQETDRD